MTNGHPLNGVSDAVGVQVRRWREWHGWSIDELAERCAAIGAPHLTTAALYALESGRREKPTGRRRRLISADELLVLAHVLKVKPDELIVPPEVGDRDAFSLTPGLSTTAGAARRWLRGDGPLDEWAAAGPAGPTVVASADTDVGALLQRVLGNPEQVAALTALLGQVADTPKGGEDA